MQFALDGSRHVVLGSNPNGHLVEVTVRDRWLITGSDNVVIAGMTLKHAPTGRRGLRHWRRESQRVRRAGFRDFGYARIGGLAFRHGTQILRNTIVSGRQLALTAYQDRNTVIRGNTISDNSYGGWDWGWMGGGMKFVGSTGLTIDANTVMSNNGPGVWCDIECSSVTISNNAVHDNVGPNVFYEISTNAKIDGNRVWNQVGNFWPALYVSTSASVEVSDNVVAWSGRGIQAYVDNRVDAPPSAGSGIFLHDNKVLMPRDGFAAFWGDAGSGVISKANSGNRGVSESYWYSGRRMARPAFNGVQVPWPASPLLCKHPPGRELDI